MLYVIDCMSSHLRSLSPLPLLGHSAHSVHVQEDYAAVRRGHMPPGRAGRGCGHTGGGQRSQQWLHYSQHDHARQSLLSQRPSRPRLLHPGTHGKSSHSCVTRLTRGFGFGLGEEMRCRRHWTIFTIIMIFSWDLHYIFSRKALFCSWLAMIIGYISWFWIACRVKYTSTKCYDSCYGASKYYI